MDDSLSAANLRRSIQACPGKIQGFSDLRFRGTDHEFVNPRQQMQPAAWTRRSMNLKVKPVVMLAQMGLGNTLHVELGSIEHDVLRKAHGS
jgi:hypothetical protein